MSEAAAILVELRRIADALEHIVERDAKPANRPLERKPPRPRRLSAEQIERVAEQTLARAGRLRR